MVCVNHGTRNGVNTCSKCGNWLCEDCTVDIDGRVVCKRCVAELLNSNTKVHPKEPAAVEKHIHHYEHHTREMPCAKRRINRLLLLCFSFTVPGVNYMFMGLMKRGIYAMAAFFLAVYCAGTLESPLFGIISGMMYVVSIFDGFHVRRKLINGEYVEDGFSGITKAIFKHKIPLAIVLFLAACSGIISRLVQSVMYSSYYRPYASNYRSLSISASDLSSVIFIILVGAAVFYFFIKPLRKAGKASKSSDSDVIDKRDYQ